MARKDIRRQGMREPPKAVLKQCLLAEYVNGQRALIPTKESVLKFIVKPLGGRINVTDQHQACGVLHIIIPLVQ
eukprot:12106-Eustigmatos_ZCMA.PRE.1